jgi:hypothetical protein
MMLRLRRFASSPPPAEGFLEGMQKSKIIKSIKEDALNNPEFSCKETAKRNTYQAINDALSIALAADEKAGICGSFSYFWRGRWVWWSVSLHNGTSRAIWQE